MRRSIGLLSAFVFACFLTGCHADVTERIVANNDRTLTVTYTESMDDEAFENIQRLGGDDPFRATVARSDGWSVTESGVAGIRQVTFIKTFPVTKVGAELLRVAYDSRSAPSDGYDFDPRSVTGDAPAGSEVPALLRPLDVLQIEGHDPNMRTARANAIINAEIVDSVASVHLEMKGVAAPLRRWNLHFATPTRIEYNGDAAITMLLNRTHSQPWPLPPAEAAWLNVGEFGVFDYERWGEPPCRVNAKYRKASKFGIGVYVSGAGIPEQLMDESMDVTETYLLKHPWKCA